VVFSKFSEKSRILSFNQGAFNPFPSTYSHMLVFDPIMQGLSLLAERDLHKAEQVFLRVINDPYTQKSELNQVREYLTDIRECQAGRKSLDFSIYEGLAKKSVFSLDEVLHFLADIYFSPAKSFAELDIYLDENIAQGVNRLQRVKICELMGRDKLFEDIDKNGSAFVRKEVKARGDGEEFDVYRWKTVNRKFIERINPILLERHLDLLEYILENNDISVLDDAKLTVLTSKYRWIIASTLKKRWYLLRSYFFKARSDVEKQFNKKDGNRKYWDDVKYKKIRIFEDCGFSEKNIQKFLFIDKLNYRTLEKIYLFAQELELKLNPRDVSLALRGEEKAKDHIKERAGFLMGERGKFQKKLIGMGFTEKGSYAIANQAKGAHSRQITDAYDLALKVASDEIFWYRIPREKEELAKNLERQCQKHLSTVRIHLFERGRLNKILLKMGKPIIQKFLIEKYGPEVMELQCYFRLETIHQYYKLKFFHYHADAIPSVSELIKISRKEFKPILLQGYQEFVKKRNLKIDKSILGPLEKSQSITEWEDPCTTVEEKILLRCWFLMDHGVSITQSRVDSGIFTPGFDLWSYLKCPLPECNS
jgi:hypothetical protein